MTPVLQKQLTRHTENSYKLVGTLQQKPRPTAKQLAAVALLSGGERTQNEMEAHGITKAVLDNLCSKGVVECSRVNKSIDLYSSIPLKNEPITLTAEQQAAYDALLPGLEDTAPHSALLYGVTGSGKTLVFLKLIERCLALGRRALVLVPEISLTPQMILRLKSRFGRRVAVQHSALNHTERLLQWQMIQDGGADIVYNIKQTKISCSTKEINMGHFYYQQQQQRELVIRNIGQVPLVINDIITSCGCTTVDYPKEPILPGKDAILCVNYQAEQPEHFNKTISIYCNVASSPVIVRLKGNAEK